MKQNQSLALHEQVLLLALRDDKGTLSPGTMYSYALAGAFVAELMLGGQIKIVTPKKKPLIELQAGASSADRLLQECILKIRNAKRRASVQTWVSRFASIRKLHHRVAEGLVHRGILRMDESKILGIFSRTVYPERDGRPEKALIAKLEKAIFGTSSALDPEIITLIALSHHSGLLKANLDKKKLRAQKKRIKAIMDGDLAGKATGQAIEAMQAAIVVACVIPTIVVTTST